MNDNVPKGEKNKICFPRVTILFSPRLTLFQGLAGLVELAEIFVAVIISIGSMKRSKTQ